LNAPHLELERAFALLPLDDAAARRLFATRLLAHDDFTRRLAAAGLLLAVAAEFADFRGLDEALATWDATAAADDLVGTLSMDRVRLDAARVALPLLDARRATDDPDVRVAAERLGAALAGPLTLPTLAADERMLLWKLLFDYRAHCLDTTALQRIAAQAQDFLREGGVSASWQARWWLLVARNHEYFGGADAAADALSRARTLADSHGLAAVRYELLCVEMTAALNAEAWPRAEAIAREIELALPDTRAGRLPAGLRAQAWWLLWRGEPGAALQRLDRLLAICADVQVPLRDQGAYQVLRSYALLALGRHADAVAVLQAQRVHQRGDQGELLEAMIGLAEGLAQSGSAVGDARICAAVADCARLNFERLLLPLPTLTAQVAEVALRGGVETEFVSRVVRSRHLRPADATRQDWPWRLQVRVFGALQVLRDGRPLPFAAKRPKKPLELLALLAAHGLRPLPQDAAIDALWPDTEDPKAALEVALARLRKLLDLPGVVQLADGGLHLDMRMVWTDAAAFEELEQRWQSTADVAAAQAAIALYRGPLLAGEPLPSAPWQLLRQQFALRHVRLVKDLGAALEARAEWRAAADAYEQGLARDLLSEPLYRALMRMQLQLGERAEALRTYRRCHEMLNSALGAAPSPETVALREQAASPG
jgi:DNA-binding SARP family transcriptional activator